MNRFNLIVIGDEILHGSRQDAHFAFFRNMLQQHGLKLGQVQYLPDDFEVLVQALQRSFSDGLPTFVTGGIGATPDDHTRQAAAAALGVPLVRHPQAAALIDGVTLERGEALDTPEHRRRLNMADFPAGSDIIPNPYNRIAGFSVRRHYFFPGFPVMAHPMAQWVLETVYADRFHRVASGTRQLYLVGQPESKIAPVMEDIERRYSGVKAYSLPNVGGQTADGRQTVPHIDFGLKAEGEACSLLNAAWADVLQQFEQAGIAWQSGLPVVEAV
ncbi:competence/damage-inducible protein A [Neisseria lisongii]|uniref:Molybdopterin-binding protein n=1 Tax=Neisseria lisongii TaxID=2912188 RepID=A0AAW5AM98_9NEIS|nr:molybdopterin-binding protein [Neisseria lisongii]MCF7529053.1 molybdopterin-binding protein [Neisseria lisongii]